MKAPVLSLIGDNYLGFRSFDGQTSYVDSPSPSITTSKRRGRHVQHSVPTAESLSSSAAWLAAVRLKIKPITGQMLSAILSPGRRPMTQFDDKGPLVPRRAASPTPIPGPRPRRKTAQADRDARPVNN